MAALAWLRPPAGYPTVPFACNCRPEPYDPIAGWKVTQLASYDREVSFDLFARKSAKDNANSPSPPVTSAPPPGRSLAGIAGG